jgi:RNA polymerase sigma factor (sigma-70 family)
VLLRVVEHFDVRYGFRFSTYATRALRREMARAVRKHTRRTQQVIAVPDLEPAAPDDWESAFDREQVAMVRAILDSLPEREREIVKQRFGFRGGQKILSYRKLSAQFGVSPERVRQLVERSFERAREEFGERLGLTA